VLSVTLGPFSGTTRSLKDDRAAGRPMTPVHLGVLPANVPSLYSNVGSYFVKFQTNSKSYNPRAEEMLVADASSQKRTMEFNADASAVGKTLAKSF